MTAIFETDIPDLELIGRGKVRDIYAVGDEHLLIVATDRLSAFDVVLSDPIPGKGAVLTGLSRFWFSRIDGIVRNHCTSIGLEDVVADAGVRISIEDQAMVVRRLAPLPIEAIVRGYLIGSGWKDYQRTGTVCGIRLPSGLRQADRLPEVIFTPSTKAEAGAHDENIDFDVAANLVGRELAERGARREHPRVPRGGGVRGGARHHHRGHQVRVRARHRWRAGAHRRGPDSGLVPVLARGSVCAGTSPPSFDKQFVRDYLETLDWGKTPPAPALPQEIIEQTSRKYREAFDRIAGAQPPAG